MVGMRAKLFTAMLEATKLVARIATDDWLLMPEEYYKMTAIIVQGDNDG